MLITELALGLAAGAAGTVVFGFLGKTMEDKSKQRNEKKMPERDEGWGTLSQQKAALEHIRQNIQTPLSGNFCIDFKRGFFQSRRSVDSADIEERILKYIVLSSKWQFDITNGIVQNSTIPHPDMSVEYWLQSHRDSPIFSSTKNKLSEGDQKTKQYGCRATDISVALFYGGNDIHTGRFSQGHGISKEDIRRHFLSRVVHWNDQTNDAIQAKRKLCKYATEGQIASIIASDTFWSSLELYAPLICRISENWDLKRNHNLLPLGRSNFYVALQYFTHAVTWAEFISWYKEFLLPTCSLDLLYSRIWECINRWNELPRPIQASVRKEQVAKLLFDDLRLVVWSETEKHPDSQKSLDEIGRLESDLARHKQSSDKIEDEYRKIEELRRQVWTVVLENHFEKGYYEALWMKRRSKPQQADAVEICDSSSTCDEEEEREASGLAGNAFPTDDGPRLENVTNTETSRPNSIFELGSSPPQPRQVSLQVVRGRTSQRSSRPSTRRVLSSQSLNSQTDSAKVPPPPPPKDDPLDHINQKSSFSRSNVV
ncbi:hypothetical protein BS50DRAFT_636910 [Corynespora cassiicola Philippines]|uniref:Uncharacterized protein n=1 Tax=Corynespora cassiicola Philippines TaxID=1448308 RepID=A0A2T2NH71_CORCC|nr:hypothetical protein BS50DRAFT_636910 [Corynespora cassiicola Philippines]